MRAALRHPAVHLLLLGLLVALAILLARGPSDGDAGRRVAVTTADLMQLRAAFVRTWQREPTDAELRGQLERYIRQEVLYREALARGYDRDDPVVRQAMQRKMEFLAASQAAQEPPADEEIEAFFALRRERYRQPAVLDFAQVYLRADGAAAAVEERAALLLRRLRDEEPAASDLAAWGDRIMLDAVHRGRSEPEIASLFGQEFAAAVAELEPGEWSGPIRSGYGLHLVKVLRKERSRIPEWTEVRARVLGDMQYEARRAAEDQLYQEIGQGYQVVMDATVRGLLEATGE